MDVPAATIRRLDRRDGLIGAVATVLALLVVFLVPEEPSPFAIAPPPPITMLPLPPVPPGLVVPAMPSGEATLADESGAAAIIDEAVPRDVTVPATSVVVGPSVPAPAVPITSTVPPILVQGAVPDVSLYWKIAEAIGTFLAAWTAALFVIRLRRPRSRRRRLMRQPGFAGCAVGLLLAIILMGADLGRWAAVWGWAALNPASATPSFYGNPTPAAASPMAELWSAILNGCGAGVGVIGIGFAATWPLMALGGWWHPERSGIDRLGRALGIAWVGLLVLDQIMDLVE